MNNAKFYGHDETRLRLLMIIWIIHVKHENPSQNSKNFFIHVCFVAKITKKSFPHLPSYQSTTHSHTQASVENYELVVVSARSFVRYLYLASVTHRRLSEATRCGAPRRCWRVASSLPTRRKTEKTLWINYFSHPSIAISITSPSLDVAPFIVVYGSSALRPPSPTSTQNRFRIVNRQAN